MNGHLIVAKIHHHLAQVHQMVKHHDSTPPTAQSRKHTNHLPLKMHPNPEFLVPNDGVV